MYSWKWSLKEIKQDKDINVFSTFSCGGVAAWDIREPGSKFSEIVRSILE